MANILISTAYAVVAVSVIITCVDKLFGSIKKFVRTAQGAYTVSCNVSKKQCQKPTDKEDNKKVYDKKDNIETVSRHALEL